MTDCQQWQQLAALAISDDLTEDERSALSEHLSSCADCPSRGFSR